MSRAQKVGNSAIKNKQPHMDCNFFSYGTLHICLYILSKEQETFLLINTF